MVKKLFILLVLGLLLAQAMKGQFLDTTYFKRGKISRIRYYDSFSYGNGYKYQIEFYRSGKVKTVFHEGVDKNGYFQKDTSFKYRKTRYKMSTDLDTDTSTFSKTFYFNSDGLLIYYSFIDWESPYANSIDSSFDKRGRLRMAESWDSFLIRREINYYNSDTIRRETYQFQTKTGTYLWIRSYYENGNIQEDYCTYYIKKKPSGLILPINVSLNQDSLTSLKRTSGKLFIREFFDNGKLKNEYFMDRKSKYDSTFKTYYKSGELLGILTYKENKIYTAAYFKKDGSILESGNFKNGNGTLIMYENGFILRKCIFKNGKGKCKCD